MITIASAMQQDEIKELLEGYNEEGMTLHLKKNKESSCSLKQVQKIRKLRLKAKELIKAQPWGTVLYFQSTAV